MTLALAIATDVLLLVLAGSVVYCVLAVIAAARYLSAAREQSTATPREPISVLKPLAGLDEGLEENLRTFFEQDYPNYEILFAVRREDDRSVAVVRKLQAEHPRVASRLLIVGEPPYANAKVFSLDAMMREARNSLLVMSDSDIRVTPDMLRHVAAEFADGKVGMATCPYRAIAGRSIWSRIEATGMNTDFIAGILMARMMDGMKFAVGPTIVARREAIVGLGGFDRVKEYLAEDFVLGKFAHEAGFGVILSSYVIEHRIGSADLRHTASHRLRWARSTRRSRPAGYVGQLFMMPVPIAAGIVALQPTWWPLLGMIFGIRAAVAYMMACVVLRGRLNLFLLAAEDVAAFVFWAGGFFGNTITWRGRKYKLLRDGRFELLDRP